ncbi:hypothetical protein GCM10027589_17730 [Actinocorallia lasiicapitis]
MISKLGRIGTVGVLVIGGAVVAGAPAQAAAKCTTGKWVLKTSSTSVAGTDSETGKFTSKSTGGAGTKLTIKSGKATVDFSKSKKAVTKTTITGGNSTLESTYRKTLKVTVKISGDKKGSFSLKPKTATGNATVRTVMTAPVKQDLGTTSAVKSLRSGEPNFLLPDGSPFTCSKSTLTFADKGKFKDETGTVSVVIKVVYRRA